jgi:hypothetical protein
MATKSAKSSMSIFSSWLAAPNSGVITYSDTSTKRHDRRVALADAGGLDDDQVEARQLAGGDDVGQRGGDRSEPVSRVASERM